MCLSKTNEDILWAWMWKIEQLGQCANWVSYENDEVVDFGTIWTHHWIKVDKIIKVSLKEFKYLNRDNEYMFYSDNYPTDAFGQKADFGNPPKYCWLYEDKYDTDYIDIPSDIEEEVIDKIVGDNFFFYTWAEVKYPHLFSIVGEMPIEDNEALFWTAFTYNPKLSEKEVITIMREYLREEV